MYCTKYFELFLSTLLQNRNERIKTNSKLDSDLTHFTFQCSCVHILDMDFTHYYCRCSTFSRLMNLVQEKELGWTSALGYPHTTAVYHAACFVSYSMFL